MTHWGVTAWDWVKRQPPLTKASPEINKNKLKMGKIGQVMSLAGAKLRVSRLAF